MKRRVNRTKRNTLVTIIAIIVAVMGRYVLSDNKGDIITQTNASNSPLIAHSSGITINYTNTQDPNYLNPRSSFLLGLAPITLAEQFLMLQNQSKFRDACSILPKKKGDKGCNSIDGNDISLFSRAVKSYQLGYENIEVQSLKNKITEYKQIVCVKYSYILKTDSNPNNIWEKYAYYFDKREDGEWELTSRVCESKFKEGIGKRDCPYGYNANQLCEGVLD